MSHSYIHGFTEVERNRLSMMQTILNQRHLSALPLTNVASVLDVGSGLGQMTRTIAENLENRAKVVGVEKSEIQREQAIRLAESEGQSGLVDFRLGDATALPLEDDEWESFDLVHTRFLLEHVPNPLAVVKEMVRAAKPGGKIFLLDDDHDLLRVSPDCPELDHLWKTYWESYRDHDCDPLVGRQLPGLLRQSGIGKIEVDSLFYGAVAGQPIFHSVVDNLIGVIDGTREHLIERQAVERSTYEQMMLAIREWAKHDSASVWYSLPIAIGTK